MINMYPEMTKTLFYLCCSCLPASQVLCLKMKVGLLPFIVMRMR